MKYIVVLLCIVVGVSGYPQQTDHLVHTEITIDRSNYVVGEHIRFSALLINEGPVGVYVSNHFSFAGGGLAGFYIDVKQISGERSNVANCEGFGDSVPGKLDRRSPQQIIKEDFILLPPGGIVGLKGTYRGCVVAHPGLYEISAVYVPQSPLLDSTSPSTEHQSMLTQRIRSSPIRFRVK